MPHTSPALGRRERNKQQKLARIVEAASELFAQRGVDDVTTQEIADKADIGTGTLFLYAKTKGELLLMVQNSHYEGALERGAVTAASIPDAVDAVMAIVAPVVECNRIQVDNGRAYLREMIFGDPLEPHHAAALVLAARTEEAVGAALNRHSQRSETEAATIARVISAVMFTTMAASINYASPLEDVIQQIRSQVSALVPN